jgi:hypothetical protein
VRCFSKNRQGYPIEFQSIAEIKTIGIDIVALAENKRFSRLFGPVSKQIAGVFG